MHVANTSLSEQFLFFGTTTISDFFCYSFHSISIVFFCPRIKNLTVNVHCIHPVIYIAYKKNIKAKNMLLNGSATSAARHSTMKTTWINTLTTSIVIC